MSPYLRLCTISAGSVLRNSFIFLASSFSDEEKLLIESDESELEIDETANYSRSYSSMELNDFFGFFLIRLYVGEVSSLRKVSYRSTMTLAFETAYLFNPTFTFKN